MITVGCAGFPVPATRYFKEFLFVEVQETHVAPPGAGTVRRWRREAPEGFRFSMVGPREIGQEGFREGMVVETALKTLETVGKELAAETVVLVAPPDFPATRANKSAVKELLGIVRQRFARVVFDPSSSWDPEDTEGMAADVGAIAARDPLTTGISKRKEAYYRLPGPAGHKSRYEDPAIDRLGELARLVQDQDATYVFTNVDMFADAKRLKKVLKLLNQAKCREELRGCDTKGGVWMGACSRCQLDLPPGAVQCPHCEGSPLLAFEVPDLDLPAPQAPQNPIKTKGKAASSSSKLSLDTSHSSSRISQPPPSVSRSLPNLDEDEDALSTSGLELAVTPSQTVPKRSSIPPAQASGNTSRVSLPPPVLRPSVSRETGDNRPDLYEIQQIARLGALPTFPWESVLYALRVFSRLREMKQEISEAEDTYRVREREAEKAILTFLNSSYDTLIKEASFARMLDPVREMQARYRERISKIEALDQEGQQELAKLDGELIQYERLAQQGRSTKEGLAAEAARLFDASREGDPLASQLLGSIRKQMQEAESEATQAVGLMNDLRRRRRESEQGFILKIQELETALEDSDGPRKKEMLEIGRALLEQQVALTGEGASAVEIANRRLLESKRRCDLLHAATSSYDRKKVQEGILYMVGSLLLLIVAIVLGVVRMNRELSVPPPLLPPV